MQQSYSTITQTRSDSVLATNKVIRNTYILLSMTLLFSAFTAWVAMATNAAPLGGILTLVLYMGLFFLTARLSNSVWGLVSIFALTGFMGYTLGPLLNYYIHAFSNGPQLVMSAMGLTGVIFFTLSGYALTTRKDFSYLGGFLFAGVITVLLASIVAMFINIPAVHLAISCAFVLLASGLILFETSQIINGGERNYIMATIGLYVQLYNLFVSLLHILGSFAGNRD